MVVKTIRRPIFFSYTFLEIRVFNTKVRKDKSNVM